MQSRTLGWTVLLFSVSTMLCCGLPLLLVMLGLGTVVVSMTSAAPWLVTLSQHKEWTFALSAAVLVGAGWAIYRAGRACPTDAARASACARADRWSRRVWWVSAGLWIASAFIAFLLLAVTRALG